MKILRRIGNRIRQDRGDTLTGRGSANSSAAILARAAQELSDAKKRPATIEQLDRVNALFDELAAFEELASKRDKRVPTPEKVHRSPFIPHIEAQLAQELCRPRKRVPDREQLDRVDALFDQMIKYKL